MLRIERLSDDVTLYLGDCRDIMPSIPRPAAVISDPPYGQSQNTNIQGIKSKRTYRCGAVGGGSRVIDGNAGLRAAAGSLHRTRVATQFPEEIYGDSDPFDPMPLLDLADIVLLWGAHRFGHRLPAGSALVWDKVPTGKVRDQGDGETAWLNAIPPRPLRIYRLLWDGVCVGPAARHEVTAGQKRVHPTQKPEALMSWCLDQARIPTNGLVCDPYMGAGSTGVAAVRAGHPFIGIEIEPVYFDHARRRIADALCRPDMFAQQDSKKKSIQLPLL